MLSPPAWRARRASSGPDPITSPHSGQNMVHPPRVGLLPARIAESPAMNLRWIKLLPFRPGRAENADLSALTPVDAKALADIALSAALRPAVPAESAAMARARPLHLCLRVLPQCKPHAHAHPPLSPTRRLS